ncbi:hypothetical protein BDB01DRAFT_893749 [Pilobolus umbonatus]|nr:hypothetical protein BDB01DRAFT_893749 [Pilobolus umbonatus]
MAVVGLQELLFLGYKNHCSLVTDKALYKPWLQIQVGSLKEQLQREDILRKDSLYIEQAEDRRLVCEQLGRKIGIYEGMAVHKYQILFSGVALSLTSGLVPLTYGYWCIQHMAACFITDIYTDGNDYPRIEHCTTSEGDTEERRQTREYTANGMGSRHLRRNIREIMISHCGVKSQCQCLYRLVVGQATTRSRAINNSKTMELPLLTSTNIYTDNDELSHQKEHCYIWIIGDTDQLEPDIE